MPSQTFSSSGTWPAPAGLAAPPQVQTWGEGGNGSAGLSGTRSGAGGGGGAFGGEPSLGGITPGSTTLTITIGTGGTGTDTTVTGGSVTVTAAHGANASANLHGAGGAAGTNTQAFAGGDGGNGATSATKGGGGGGSSAGSAAAGNNGTTASTSSGAAGGTAPSGGGNGGNGGSSTTAGNAGTAPGGGGGGGGDSTSQPGAAGQPGQVIITWTVVTISPFGYMAAAGVMSAAKKAVASLKGYLPVVMAPPVPQVVNAWKATFAQPASFQTTPPMLQSTVVALTPAGSAGSGTGVPTAGNWLVCVIGWNQAGLPAATIEAHDDVHSFWRPGNVLTSAWAVSASSGKTRTSIWYTANLARAPGDVYVAPNGAMAGMACLVLELSATGPWDVVTGIAANYAGAATSLNLALAAPASASFLLAAVTGDSAAAGQSFAPAGWTPMPAVSAGNGTDHTCDAVLTTAVLMTTSSSASVTATTSSTSDLSGVIIGFRLSAPSPVPAGQNPNWPYLIVEAAFGSGYQTPADQMTWTSLNNWTTAAIRRLWAFSDDTGVPYGLGQLQSGSGGFTLDNSDGALCPWNSASPFFPLCVTGTPIRIRAAIGTIKGVVTNRWYIIQRNADEFPEKRSQTFRDYVPLTTTDSWSVAGGTCPSPYRGEIRQDSPYAWWPMDDQPLPGGVQPTSLRNAAAGNTNVLNVIAASGGVSATDAYSTAGADLTATGTSSTTPPLPSVATYAAGQQQGWGYGDPQSSPASYATSNPVTSNPGSAAWQQSGMQGNTGAQGWFLAVSDTGFPALSGPGATVKVWFNPSFFGSATGYTDPSLNRYVVAGQPYSVITLATLSTSSAPVAELQLDLSGHLNLVTFSGTTPASNTVYSSSDLRNGSWTCVDITLTSTAWTVYVNGGITAKVSGTAAGMSNFTWATINGDYGNSAGGSSPASLQHGGNVAYSHATVFSGVLPAWRIMAHYCAMITGFGLLPAPQSLNLSKVANKLAGSGYTPDGSEFQGSYGIPAPGTVGSYAFSAVAVAQAGSYTSGPSARAASAGYGTDSGGTFFGDAVFVSLSSLAPSAGIYTASAANSETNAATINGSGDSFTAGYGSGATGAGVCQTSAGTGASPPASPSSLGDSVAQRLERVFGYGLMTCPNRAIDASANLLVQAALDVGGQSAGANAQAMTDSDNGLAFIDNCNTNCYRSRAHLAGDVVAWNIGMNVISGMVPFGPDIEWSSDPQRVYTVVGVTQYSPDGGTLATLTPANATAVNAAQKQYGPRPKTVTSYLQDPAKVQSAVNWWFSAFGSLQRRAKVITIDAAEHPAAWPMVLGMNPGDLASIFDDPFGVPANTGTYRVSQIRRNISFGAIGSGVQGKAVVVLDPVTSYWS